MKKLVYLLITSCLLPLVSGCNEVLDQVPVSALTQSSFFKTSDDAEAAILACYDAIQGDDMRRIVWGDAHADNMVEPIAVLGPTDPSILDFMNDNISNGSGFATWSVFYTGIGRINTVLKQVPTIQDPKIAGIRDRVLGEAYFLRAFNYFFMTRLWGAVPLVLQPTESLTENLQIARTPADQVLDNIITDLLQAEKLLPVSYSSNLETRGRATRGAAQALLSKVYLWRSSFMQKNEWQQTVDYAAKVVANPTYSLVAGNNYASIFTARNTTESIFELQYNYNNQETNQFVFLFLPRSTKVQTGGSQVLIPSPQLVAAFEPGDLRQKASIFYSDSLSLYPNVPTVGKYPGTIVGAARFSDSNYIFLRLADVLLMQSEALAQLGNTADAISIVNRIRNRAGLANTKATTKEEVLLAIEQERFVELCFEGHRWYDLLRTGRVQAKLGTKKSLLPVPLGEILLNPNLLPQNPGY